MTRILIAEDDNLIAELERDYLLAENFQVDIASDGQKALDMLGKNEYDFALLDVMLPKVDGFSICRMIRSDSDIPVMIVTAKRDDVDKIRGLGLGADDYMVKPFSPTEMVARVKAHLRIHERLKAENMDAKPLQQINIRGLRILPEAHRVFKGDEEIKLVNREFEVLLLLMENPDKIFSKEHIFETVWGVDSLGDTATVAVHINRIREKIEENPSMPTYIETVWGAGYRFSAI